MYTDDGFARLQVAIVKQTADDYRKAYRKWLKLKRNGKAEEIRHARDRCVALEKWFFSDWGALLCNDLGGVIIKKIQREEEQQIAKGVKTNGAKP